MKFKKLFFTFAVALCVCMLTFCIFAEEFAPGTGSVYFVSNAAGKDTNAGTSATAPLKTLGKANAYLREAHGGTIVICGDVDISTTFAPADIGGAVVYTSEYDGVDYRENGASLNIGANMAFNNDTYFENITLELSASGISIAARCNNLGFGYGVNTVNASALEDFTFPIIIGGFNNPSSLEESSSSNNYSIHIYNGNWNAVYGGNRRPVPNANPVSDLSGDVAVLIKGGTFDNIVSAAGMCVHSGRVYLGIFGGTFNSAVVPIRRLGEMPSDSTLITDADFTANVLVHIDGGTFNGRFRLAESTIETTAITKMPLGDATVVVTGGTYNYADFVGYGVAGSVLLKYDPEVLKNVTIKGFPLKTTTTAMSKSDEEKATFTNPIGDKADPYVIEKDGLYYYCFSSGTTVDGTSYAGVKVAVHENLPFGELSTQIRAVFNASQTDIANAKQNYWAPELHYFDAATVGKENAGWYIYVAADDGDTKHHRMYVLRATDRENPLSDFEMVGQITDSTNKWAIDGTVMVHGGKLYFIWSGWEGDTDGYQNIYIAQMSNPWTVSSSRVLLSRPEYSWETNGYPDINEGPQVLKAPDGTVHIIYSASTSFSQYYCYGALTLTGTNPLDKASWYKSPTALFSSGNGAYGTGHGSFVKDDDGNFWMYYHANPSLTVPEDSTWWAERSTYVKPFSFTKKTVNGKSVSYPSFGTPVAPNSTQTISVDTADYHEEDAHHYSPVFTISSGEVTELYRTCYICGEKNVESVAFAKALSLSLKADTDSVSVKWNKIDGVDGYRIYRKDERNAATEHLCIADLDANELTENSGYYTYTDENLESGIRYNYLVHAYHFDVNNEYKYTSTAAKSVATALCTPTISVTQTSGNTITISISAIANVDSYVIFRRANGLSFVECARIPTPEYVDGDIVAETEYEYKVIAINSNSRSAYSETIKITAKVMGVMLDKVTEGDIFDAINKRNPQGEVAVFTSAGNLGETVIVSKEAFAGSCLYSMHGEYIVPAEKYEEFDEDNYVITFRHANADAIIFSENEIVHYGDATSDGEITLLDVLRTIRYITNDEVPLDIAATDTNYDLSTDIEDILGILNLALK